MFAIDYIASCTLAARHGQGLQTCNKTVQVGRKSRNIKGLRRSAPKGANFARKTGFLAVSGSPGRSG
jgi:hypothetical protein